MKNHRISFKGINLFGLIITTKKQIENAKMSADELIINPTEEQLKKGELKVTAKPSQ